MGKQNHFRSVESISINSGANGCILTGIFGRMIVISHICMFLSQCNGFTGLEHRPELTPGKSFRNPSPEEWELRERDFYQFKRISPYGRDYQEVFIRRVHELLGLAYNDLNSGEYAASEEEDITGELIRAIESLLDSRRAPDWADWYSVHEESRIHSKNRRGKRRRRLDIRIDCSEQRPRTRMSFEAKRLGPDHGTSEYIGKDGLQCFLDGRYARNETVAGMLGYVQEGEPSEWALKVEKTMNKNAEKLGLLDSSPWRHEQQVNELPHTYRSGHERPSVGQTIEIFHTFLIFN